MGREILSQTQKKFLAIVAANQKITKNFYFTGGTALAVFYLNHRYSEDLDFFTEKEDIDAKDIMATLKGMKLSLGFSKIDFEPSFNRNIFFIYFGKKVLKTEFTYFPFPRIKKGTAWQGLSVDSPEDIAVNKFFTIYQKPRSRDFIDLYFIIKKYQISFKKLMELSRVKFDWHIDPLTLGTRLMTATEVKDYPKMLKDISHSDWQDYFINQAKKLQGKILQ